MARRPLDRESARGFPRHVMMIAAECAPLAKVGGLGDVVAALARHLDALGIRVTVVLPGYASLDRRGVELTTLEVRRAAESESVPVTALEQGRLPDGQVEVLVVHHPRFFRGPSVYAPEPAAQHEDVVALEAARWSWFARAALLAGGRLAPDAVLHLHDHHAALAAAFVRAGAAAPWPADTPIVFSIHNLGYQGVYPLTALRHCGLPAAWTAPLGPLEYWGSVNCMKAGIVLSDVVTTVSPTYAGEIQEDSERGHGLDGVLRSRAQAVVGILNGIDTEVWNPATDPYLPAHYDRDHLEGKRTCKARLREELGLEPGDRPLFGVVSRLVPQKGIELIPPAATSPSPLPVQWAILGEGDADRVTQLRTWSREHPEHVAFVHGFDEGLAHRIEAGADFFVMPSRYEPCGLNQMYSLRYGTLPVVRATGGLADTVEDWDPASDRGHGIVFGPHDAAALRQALLRAVAIHAQPEVLGRLRRRAMGLDFSWKAVVGRYREVYRRAARYAGPASVPASSADPRGGGD